VVKISPRRDDFSHLDFMNLSNFFAELNGAIAAHSLVDRKPAFWEYG